MAQQYPEGVTEEWLAKQRKKALKTAEKAQKENPPIVPRALDDEHYIEAYVSGQWLWERLLEAGCSKETAHEITSAHGQIAFHVPAWEAAQKALEDWVERKVWEKPGVELADRLIKKYGLPYHLLANVIEYLGEDLFNKEKLDEVRKQLAEKMKNTKYP